MDSDTKLIGNMALLPIRSQFKGPAPRESKFGIIPELLDVVHHLRVCSKSGRKSHQWEMESFAVERGGKSSTTSLVQIVENNYAQIIWLN